MYLRPFVTVCVAGWWAAVGGGRWAVAVAAGGGTLHSTIYRYTCPQNDLTYQSKRTVDTHVPQSKTTIDTPVPLRMISQFSAYFYTELRVRNGSKGIPERYLEVTRDTL
jgi:hypothetical protein